MYLACCRLVVALSVVLSLACVSDNIDPAAPFFESDRVLEISIDMAPGDWDELRGQTRSIFDVLGSSCLAAPAGSPFTYFSATVTIDGETMTQVGVRKKGFFGSLSEIKPSFKIKFSKFLLDQRFHSIKRMTLNNNKSDPSHVKQCLGYDLFAQAGVVAPRCNFAHVTVNGEDLGIFSHVETVKKRFLGLHFDDNDGNLYEGALSDFRPGWVETFTKKTNDISPDRSDLEALVPALQAGNANLLARLEPLLDVDNFVSFWAMELLVMHADGYARNTNNFFLYHDPSSGKFQFIPWGIDSIMFPDQALPWEGNGPPPTTIWAEGVLARRLYLLPETQSMYLDRVQALLDTVWNESAILAEIDRMQTLIQPYVLDVPAFQSVLTSVRDFVNTRRSDVETALGLGPEPWTLPLRDPWCIASIGDISFSFAGPWVDLNDNQVDPFTTGNATVDINLPGLVQTGMTMGATVGIDTDSGQPAIRLASWLVPGQEALLIFITVKSDQFVANNTVATDWVDASGLVARVTFPGGVAAFEILGMIADGSLQLDQVSMTPNQIVAGSLSSLVYEPIF